MTPQLPSTSLGALISTALTRDVDLTVWVADLTGRFDFLDERGRDALIAGGLRVGMYAGAAPRHLAPHVERHPGTLYDVDRALARGTLAADVCLVRAGGSPDAVDLGSVVGLTPTAIAAGIPLAVELGGAGATAIGSAGPPIRDVTFIWIDHEPASAPPHGRPASSRQQAVAENVVSLLPPEATLQVGIGAVADAIVARLDPSDGMRFHSGTLPAGARRVARSQVGGGPHIATAFAPDAGGEPWPESVRLLPVSTTHSPETLGGLERLWAVNSALTVSLDGDADAEWIGDVRAVCGGGQLDFARAAARSPGGGSVLALASRTNDGASRIVTSLPEGRTATTSGAYVDAIVTEHGVAVLRGLAPEQRAAAIIAIAHPDDRAGLAGAMEVARQRR
jgi:hypothetical protein